MAEGPLAVSRICAPHPEAEPTSPVRRCLVFSFFVCISAPFFTSFYKISMLKINILLSSDDFIKILNKINVYQGIIYFFHFKHIDIFLPLLIKIKQKVNPSFT